MVLNVSVLVLALMLAVMTAAWLTVRATDNGGWTDVFWTFGSGLALVVAALVPAPDAAPWRQAMVAALVALWSLRLGLYITRRVAGGAEDVRYVALKAEWGPRFLPRMAALLLIQAPATALLAISVILAAHTPDPALRLRDLLGAAILVLAIAGEASPTAR